MKILHILRSEPDEVGEMFRAALFKDSESIQIPLYEGALDYDWLIQQFFAADKVVSWW
jgi:hypothetical protein